MKTNSIIILCALLFFASCKQNVQLTGELKNMPPQTIILEEITVGDPVFLDSTTTAEDGKFTFSIDAPEEKMLRISFIDKKFILLALKNADKAVLKGDWNTIEQYTVEGSKTGAILKKLILGTRENIVSINTMSMIVDTLKKSGAPADKVKSATEALQRENTNFMSYLKAYADTTNSVSAALMAVNLINPSFEGPFVQSFYDGLEKRFPNSTLATSYKERFAAAQAPASSAAAPAAAGTPAPDFSASAPDGKTIRLSDFKGKYVLLDFWASWCKPCRMENPTVVKAYNQFKDKNFTVLGFSLDNDKNNWKKAIKADGLTWAHASELKGWQSPVAALYQINSIPANLLIDPDGNIIAKDLRGAQLINTLQTTLK